MHRIILRGYNYRAAHKRPDHDFSDKTIIPFVTHGGSGFSRTLDTIKELEPDANVITDGLSVSRNSVADAQDDVIEWVY